MVLVTNSEIEAQVKQLLQNISKGQMTMADVPSPLVSEVGLLVATTCSLVSSGTERMMVEFGRAGWISKARQQPDKVRMVVEKIRTDGLAATFDAVRSKLDQPLAPGYCNVGRVLQVGASAGAFKIGDRVISNGKHAEIVSVSRNLCARIPDQVSDEQAVFAVLGSIGLQGVRLAQTTIGECVVVTGLGLIGLLTVQILRANGCRVMGIDVDPARLDLARRFGAEELVNAGAGECPIAAASRFSRGRGVDAVLLTLATKSSEPLHQAAQMCRKRGRIVLVGIAGLELSRADFYEKELSFQVSCSYGPGRYDPDYEEKGVDYPVGFVRWTEQRNFEAVLDLMAGGALDLAPLISHRFDFADAPEAYELLASKEESLGILLRYPAASAERRPEHIVDLGSSAEAVSGSSAPSGTKTAGVLVIGAGNYAGRVLIPAFQAAGAQLATLVSAQGVSASHYGRRFGFKRIATDAGAALAENGSEIVVIATRHDSHAEHVIAAMAAHKHVFVEKPLCLTLDELRRIDVAVCEAAKQSSSILMVGFNRRFAPLVQRAHSLLHAVNQPRAVMITVNAGQIPASHWTQDLAVGGGRIVGEACHFIDLARFLVGHPVRDWTVHALNGAPRDSVAISLAYEDGSIATINYLANGHRVVPKERIEVYCAGRVIELDNFRRLRAHGWADFSRQSNWRQDKGQQNCVKAFVEAVRAGRASPIPYNEVLESSRIAIEVQQRLQAK